MPRGLEHLQAKPREIKPIAVIHGDELVFRLCACAEVDCGAAGVAQLQVAGDEVGVEVAEEDVADLKTKPFGVGEILLDVALRIDDDGGLALLITEQIGGVCQASEVVLLQDHRSLMSLALQACGGQSENLLIR